MAEMNMSHSLVVDAPIDKVFDAFCNPQIIGEWFGPKIRGYEPPLVSGKKFETVTNFLGGELITKHTVTEVDPPNRYVRTIAGPLSGEIQQLVEAVENGVKVSIIFNAEMKGFLANLAAPVVRNQAKKQMKNDLNSFKAYIES